MAELGDVRKILDGLIDGLQSQAEMNKLGEVGVKIIKTRTRAWRDVEGRRLKDYSPAYKTKRILEQKAVTPRGPTVDSMLVWNSTDGMMQKVNYIVGNDFSSVVIDILDARKKQLMYYHSEAGVAKKGENIRHVWGMSDKEWTLIAKIFSVDFANLLAKLTDEAQ
jgi:hypothetical protein